MSFFSKLRNSKKAAHEVKLARAAEEQKERQVKPPYKHIPTHAASDALRIAPPSASADENRAAIRAQNVRRSVMPPEASTSEPSRAKA